MCVASSEIHEPNTPNHVCFKKGPKFDGFKFAWQQLAGYMTQPLAICEPLNLEAYEFHVVVQNI